MEIRFSKIGRQCSACGAPFRHLEKVRSIAARLEDAQADPAGAEKVRSGEGTAAEPAKEERRPFERMDFCPACTHRTAEFQAWCTWTATYVDPDAVRQEEPLSPLRRIFYAHSEDPDREKQAVAFLAAEMLRRHRAFRKIRETVDESDRRTLWYLDKSRNRIIEVVDPSFTYAELDRARMTLLEAIRTADQPASGSEAPAGVTSGAEPVCSPEGTP